MSQEKETSDECVTRECDVTRECGGERMWRENVARECGKRRCQVSGGTLCKYLNYATIFLDGISLNNKYSLNLLLRQNSDYFLTISYSTSALIKN